jgi:hypothetical protein
MTAGSVRRVGGSDRELRVRELVAIFVATAVAFSLLLGRPVVGRASSTRALHASLADQWPCRVVGRMRQCEVRNAVGKGCVRLSGCGWWTAARLLGFRCPQAPSYAYQWWVCSTGWKGGVWVSFFTAERRTWWGATGVAARDASYWARTFVVPFLGSDTCVSLFHWWVRCAFVHFQKETAGRPPGI